MSVSYSQFVLELLVSLLSIIITELGEEEIGYPSGKIHLDRSQSVLTKVQEEDHCSINNNNI